MIELENIRKEYELLLDSLNALDITRESTDFTALKEVNLRLWLIEDAIRIKESRQEFDQEFIRLARSVYFENDLRAEIKKKINRKYGSELIEEKEYVEYN